MNRLCGLSELVTVWNSTHNTHTHTHTHIMLQLVTLHCNAHHSHKNHFMVWTLHGQNYKSTPFWHLIAVPWTCTGLTPAFTLMWCHCLHSPSPSTTEWASLTACMETTSTQDLTWT
jgi:hypothetical protein